MVPAPVTPQALLQELDEAEPSPSEASMEAPWPFSFNPAADGEIFFCSLWKGDFNVINYRAFLR